MPANGNEPPCPGKKAVLTPEAVMELVRNNHPVAKQAALLVNRAAAELQSARGGFDPALQLDASRKTFDGKNYYYYTNPELQLPTAAAVTLRAGTESNGGDQLANETTRGRSSYLGIELPLGNGLSTDDFGTGYSSLSYLHQFPFKRIKIDRSFVVKMDGDRTCEAIVRTILMLANNLGMNVVAEGIEMKTQLEKLQVLGCHAGQGYLFSKPVDAKTAQKLLKTGLTKEYFPGIFFKMPDFGLNEVIQIDQNQ